MAKSQFCQWFGIGARRRKPGVRRGARLALAAGFGLALMTVPVLAQFGGRGGGMFDFFGPFSGQRYQSERPQDFTRAPPPRKLEVQPAGSVLVFGDSMADWLASGLEDALGDTPDLAVVRRARATAGLIRYDARNESQDWAQVIREAIGQVKPKVVVMMLGLNDRQPMRERPLQSGAPGSAAGANPPPLVPQAGAAAAPPPADATDTERPAGEPSSPTADQKAAPGLRTYEFRSEEWAEYYTRRIDATIAALKSAGVPVFWVGLPSVRGPKSTAEMLYLNDLYRTRVEKAGATYIDVWDGFVDEGGRFTVQGPDFEGQIRRLRVSDGVHFTKAGSRKLAHYLEREMRRVTSRGLDLVSIPAEPTTPAPSARPGSPTARPLSGPVVQLTATAGAGQELLGAADASAAVNPRAVTRVLVKGEAIVPPAGRSDDFRWPRRGVAAFGTDPVVATTTDPVPVVAAAPPPAIAAAPAPDAKVAPGAKKQPRGQAGQQPQARRTTGGGGGFLPFGR